jgi:hypothetical protein
MATLLHAASTGNAQPFYGLADPEVCACCMCCTAVVQPGYGCRML